MTLELQPDTNNYTDLQSMRITIKNIDQRLLDPESLERKLYAILQDIPKIRSQLVTATKVPRSTVYDTLVRMMNWGIVLKYVETPERAGRPCVYFAIVEDSVFDIFMTLMSNSKH